MIFICKKKKKWRTSTRLLSEMFLIVSLLESADSVGGNRGDICWSCIILCPVYLLPWRILICFHLFLWLTSIFGGVIHLLVILGSRFEIVCYIYCFKLLEWINNSLPWLTIILSNFHGKPKCYGVLKGSLIWSILIFLWWTESLFFFHQT